MCPAGTGQYLHHGLSVSDGCMLQLNTHADVSDVWFSRLLKSGVLADFGPLSLHV